MAWATVLGDVRRAGFGAEAAPDSPRIAWSAAAGRGLLAAPMVAGSMLFTGTSNRMVMAFNAENGTKYWERHIDGAVSYGLVAGSGHIYVETDEREGTFYALEPGRGESAWHRTLGYGAAAPLLIGDTLIVPLEDGRIVALRGLDGETRWTARLTAAPATTPVPFRDVIVIAVRNDSIFAVDRRSGRVATRAALGGHASSTPALAGDTLYVPVETGGIVALRLPAFEPLFRTGGAAPVLAPVAVAPDRSVWYLDAAADLWRVAPGAATATRMASPGGAARGALTLTRDGLLAGRLDGSLALYRFDGSLAWTAKLDGAIAAPAAVVGGAAYVPLLRGRIVKVK